jgi:hypothetical protein
MTDNFPCGPDSWKTAEIPWLLRLHAPQFVFRDACRAHDEDYAAGGEPHDRLLADQAFYGSMIQSINGRPPLSRLYFGFFAWVYYRAVRQYGKYHFSYKVDTAERP